VNLKIHTTMHTKSAHFLVPVCLLPDTGSGGPANLKDSVCSCERLIDFLKSQCELFRWKNFKNGK
jgi:hypothetical protein